jgi:hypothetical protein
MDLELECPGCRQLVKPCGDIEYEDGDGLVKATVYRCDKCVETLQDEDGTLVRKPLAFFLSASPSGSIKYPCTFQHWTAR